ncbi:MAG TPA: protein kinase [Gemmatimonadales bacterium]|nr:protein kinase [Gemmatimonadales bacterium]
MAIGFALEDALRGRYTVERELGRGGMATVFLAHDLRHDRSVALKVLHAELVPQHGPQRFLREIKVAARLQHPHILTVLDSGELADGRLWFTMPYVEGESLRDRLRREGPLPLEDAMRIAREVADGLHYAHGHGVIHRDIKPENILLAAGHALIADFGIARGLVDTGPQPAEALDGSITLPGTVIGSPLYMSPEQASGEGGLDGRVDLYALAVVLYEMLVGKPPFSGTSPHAVLAQHLMAERPGVRPARPSVPAPIEAAILKAMASDPGNRFASTIEFAQALERGAVAPAGRRRMSRAAGTLVALGLIGLGAGSWWLVGLSGNGVAEETATARLAVLPFENVGDAENAYFADGVADAVRGKLSALPGLQVIASSSSDQYREAAKSPRDIGRELGAQYLLVGKVRWQRGVKTSRVQVSPELIEASSGTTRWQQLFDAPLTDVFGMQEEITRGVADALELRMNDVARVRVQERPTRNLGAYDAFLRGERLSNRVGVTDALALRNAISSYEEATALDPNFALAWAQLSRARSTLYVNLLRTPEDAEAARVAAERAVALGPSLPQAHFARALYLSAVRREHVRALEEVARGRRTAPRDAELLSMAALAEQQLGRWDQAVAHFRQAQSIDPLSFGTRRRLARALLWLRRYPEARAMADSALRLSGASPDVLEMKAATYLGEGNLEGARAALREAPQELELSRRLAHAGAYFNIFWVLPEEHQQLLLRLGPGPFNNDRGMWGLALAQTHAVRGNAAAARAYADSALAATERATKANPRDGILRGSYALALALAGRREEAVREGERAIQLEPIATNGITGPIVQHFLVLGYLALGEHEAALDRLEPLLRVPFYLSPAWLRIDPTLAPLHDNPRFKKLIEE